MFGVSLATIKRYLKQRRESGHLIPKAIPGRPAKKGGALQVGLGTQLAAHPDMTLDEHCRLWEMEHGQRVSTTTMSRAITRLGWTRKKKTLVASERDETARAAWRKQARQHTNQQWVFVDECGSHIALTPLYARAPRLQAITAQDARGWFTHCGYFAEEPSCSDSEATMAQSL